MKPLSSFGRRVAATAFSNIAATIAAGFAGLVIARVLGPSVRGEYAAIVAWFGILISVGQLGQNTAITFFVSGDRRRAPDYVATARVVTLGCGAIAVAAGLLAAPVLAGGNDRMLAGYQLMFGACLVSFATMGFTFALQATDIKSWNLARLVQPLLYAAVIVTLQLAGWLTLMTALGAITATLAAQALLAWRLCAQRGLTGGRMAHGLLPPLTRYGVQQFASTAPAEIISRLDVLVLSLTVAPAALGQYAVAASLTALVIPAVSAIGYVAFPRIASGESNEDSFQRRTVAAAGAGGAVAMAPIVLLSPWLVPLVFGAGYQQAVMLVSLLAPAGVFLACGQVAGDVLRGRGQPIAVARAQGAAALVTIVLMSVLVPRFGVVGAAITTSAAAGAALLLMVRAVLVPGSRPGATAQPGSRLAQV